MWSGFLKDVVCRKTKWSSHRTSCCHIDIKVLVWGFVLGCSRSEYQLMTGLRTDGSEPEGPTEGLYYIYWLTCY